MPLKAQRAERAWLEGQLKHDLKRWLSKYRRVGLFPTLRFQECIGMKCVNNVVYTDAEWKRNQTGILISGWLFIWGFILLWVLLG